MVIDTEATTAESSGLEGQLIPAFCVFPCIGLGLIFAASFR
jgi:hypothetical protein